MIRIDLKKVVWSSIKLNIKRRANSILKRKPYERKWIDLGTNINYRNGFREKFFLMKSIGKLNIKFNSQIIKIMKIVNMQ